MPVSTFKGSLSGASKNSPSMTKLIGQEISSLALEKLTAVARPLKIPVMSPAVPPTLERVRKMVKQGIKAITLPNQFASFNNVCRKCVEEIVTPIREEM